MPGKSRAVAYSDYYKNREKTPESDEEAIPTKKVPVPMSKRVAPTDKEDRRKAALKRRLAALREGK